MTEQIAASVASTLPQVTTISRYDGIGVGRIFEGRVYVSGGNGWYYPDIDLASYLDDDGAAYMQAVRTLQKPDISNAIPVGGAL